jgi:hypothetical protein
MSDSNSDLNPVYRDWVCFMAILDNEMVTHFLVPPENELAIAAWRSNPTIVETVWHKLPMPGSIWNGSFTDPQFTPGE